MPVSSTTSKTPCATDSSPASSTAQSLPEVELVPVTTLEQVETMRLLRNACREWMTRDTSEISQKRQSLWWGMLDKEKTRCYLLMLVARERPLDTTHPSLATLGYGVVNSKDGFDWLSGGLASSWRGQGYGKRLFRLLVDACALPPKLEVLRFNEAAVATYLSLGFEECGGTAEVMEMML